MKYLQSDDSVYEFVCTWYGSVNRFCDHCVAFCLPTNEKRCSGNFMKLMVWFWWQVICISYIVLFFSSSSSLCNWLILCLACVHLQKQQRASQKDSKIQFCYPTEKDMVQGNMHSAKTVNLEKNADKNGTRIKKKVKKPKPCKIALVTLAGKGDK